MLLENQKYKTLITDSESTVAITTEKQSMMTKGDIIVPKGFAVTNVNDDSTKYCIC